VDHMKQHLRPQSFKGFSWEGSIDYTGSTGSGSCHTLHTVAAETQGQYLYTIHILKQDALRLIF